MTGVNGGLLGKSIRKASPARAGELLGLLGMPEQDLTARACPTWPGQDQSIQETPGPATALGIGLFSGDGDRTKLGQDGPFSGVYVLHPWERQGTKVIRVLK